MQKQEVNKDGTRSAKERYFGRTLLNTVSHPYESSVLPGFYGQLTVNARLRVSHDARTVNRSYDRIYKICESYSGINR